MDEDDDCCKLRSLKDAGTKPARTKGNNCEFERASDECCDPIMEIRQLGFKSYQKPGTRK